MTVLLALLTGTPSTVIDALAPAAACEKPNAGSLIVKGVLPSSLTFHVQHLYRAGLVSQRRLGRQLIYAADYTAMNGLIAYLTENCCGRGAVAPCWPVPATRAARTRKSA